MARRRTRNDPELDELGLMEKDEDQNRATRESKPPTGGRWVKNYTSGTMHRAETGRYMSAKWVNPYTGEERPATIDGQGSRRPASHGKIVGTGSARVSRGAEKPAAAQRGVGQPTVDGFINGLSGRNKRRAPRRK